MFAAGVDYQARDAEKQELKNEYYVGDISEADAENESDSNDDKKPIAKSPNYYKFNARIEEEDHKEEQEEEEYGELKAKPPSKDLLQ